MSKENTLYEKIVNRIDIGSNADKPSNLFNDEESKVLSSYVAGPENITQFNNNPNVIKNYEIVTDYLADNKGFMSSLLDSGSWSKGEASEFMRDSTIRVSSLVTQAAKMDDAPEEVKKAYRDLRSQWNDVSIDGGSEWFNFVKDYGTDVIASYETLPIVLSMIFGGPAGGAASASTHAAAKLALHKALSKSANFVGGNTVKSAAAYAGGITGIHDLASQDVAVDLGEKENINLAQTAAFTGLGSLFGAGVAYGLRKLTSKTDRNRLVRDLEEDGTGTVNKNNASSVVDEGIEGEWIPSSAGPILKEAEKLIGGRTAKIIDGEAVDEGTKEILKQLKLFVDDIGGGERTFEELETIILGELRSGTTGKKIKNNIAFNLWKTSTDLIGNFLGKGAGILTPYTKFSKTAQTLQERLSHEFAEGFKIQKSKVGHDFSEAATNTSSRYNEEYLKIVEPLALNSIKGNLSDDVNDALLAAIRGKKSGNKKIDLAATQIQKLFRNIGNDLYSNGIIARQVDNYIPRMWNRKAILNNQDSFDEKLVAVGEAKSLTEARRISDGMLDLENQLDGGSGGTYFASKRKFKFKDDSEFTDFLNPDLVDTITQYNFQAGKALAKKKVLLSSNESDFIKNWINPIVEEMKQSGKVLSKKEREQIRSLYRHATGEKMDRFGTAGQVASDGYTLATRLALLPLATVGSITEIFINLGKAGFKNTAKGFVEAGEAGFKKISNNLHKDLMSRHGMTSNEAWRELKKHGIAMEQAQAQIGQRLVGDDLATDSMQKISNKFFRINLLDQWTKFVQMTSFASGKNMIKENLEIIASHGNNPMNKKIERVIGELNELNVDYKKGVNWVKGGAKTEDSFYNQVTAGAARYTNTVILQPTAMSGLKPLLHTNPRTTVLFQLLGYPAAFTNTIIKGAAKAAIKAPTRNIPKLFAAGFVMTETARWMNWLRTRGESEKYKEPHEIRLAAIRRWGGNGLLFDNLTRASDAAKYSGNVAGFATAPFGPIANDILGLGSGKFFQTAGTKIPFYAAGNPLVGQEKMREYRSFLKEKDKGLKGLIPEFKKDIRREYYDKGGEVDIPNAPKEPDERINKLTGLPYNYEAGSAFMDSDDPEKIERQGFVVGSLVKAGSVALKGFIAEAIDDAAGGLTKPEVINKAAKQIEQATGLRPTRSVDDIYDTMDMDMPTAGMLDESEQLLEDYTLNYIKLHLNEKLPELDDVKGSEILNKFGPKSKQFYDHMGYDKQFRDTVKDIDELKDIVDPTGEISFDIANALSDVFQNKNYLGFSSASQKNLDKIDKLGLNEVAEFLSHRLAVDETVSNIGKVNAVKNELANKLDDPRFVQVLENLKNSLPSRTSDDLDDILPEKELTERLEVYVGKSTEKKPQYRAISSYNDLDFDIAFFSPREMGVHVGAQGQAEFIAARAINQNRAVDEFSIPSRAFDDDVVDPMEGVKTVTIPSWWKETTDKQFATSPEKSIKTQAGNTVPTYKKAKEAFTVDGKGLDYGSGLGKGAKAIGFDSFEVNPKDYVKPDFTDSSLIPNASYEMITDLNVLNVVEKSTRDFIVKDIFRILKKDGEAIISTRGKDIYGSSKSPVRANIGSEEGSIITSTGTFQKGFTQKELEAYIKSILGDSVTISKFGGGQAGVKITKVKDTITDSKIGFDPIARKEMDEFYESESVRLTDFEEIDWDNITLDEFQKLKTLQDEGDVPSLDPDVPPVSMVKGYIQVKNPLVIESDMANWSAENLLTQGSSMFISSIAKQTKKSISKIEKELEPLMEQAIRQTNNDLTNLAPKPSALVDGVVNNVDLTKKLQKYLEDSGFDSIKYRNEVEPLLETDIPKGYEPYSYILFKPKQYKSVLARQYNEEDPRFNYRMGGVISDKVNEEDRSLSLFEQLKGVKKAVNTQVFDNFIDHFNPFQGDKTEKDYRPQVIEALRFAARNAIKDGRKNIDYSDYNLAESDVKKQVMSPKQREIDNLQSRMLSGDITPTEEAAFSVGGAQLVVEDGQVYATDVYDFSKIGSRISNSIPDSYSKLRKLVGNINFGNEYKSKINLGAVEDFIN